MRQGALANGMRSVVKCSMMHPGRCRISGLDNPDLRRSPSNPRRLATQEVEPYPDGRAASWTGSILRLQKLAGNRAVADFITRRSMTVQRCGPGSDCGCPGQNKMTADEEDLQALAGKRAVASHLAASGPTHTAQRRACGCGICAACNGGAMVDDQRAVQRQGPGSQLVQRACAYDSGEKRRTRFAGGILDPNVMLLGAISSTLAADPESVVVADFPAGSAELPASTIAELRGSWIGILESQTSRRYEMLGFTDCVGDRRPSEERLLARAPSAGGGPALPCDGEALGASRCWAGDRLRDAQRLTAGARAQPCSRPPVAACASAATGEA